MNRTFQRFRADRCLAGEFFTSGVASHPHEINLLDFAARELRLDESSKVPRASHDHDARCVSVEAMRGLRPLRVVHLVEHVLKGVAEESSTRVHRQWRGLVQHDYRFIFVQHLHAHVDVGLDHAGDLVQIAFAGPHDLTRWHRLTPRVEDASLLKAFEPRLHWDVASMRHKVSSSVCPSARSGTRIGLK